MPRIDIDYSNTIIYKIACKDLSIKDIYVGSTVQFENRINHHISVCNNPNSKAYNYYVYEFIRENGGFENWQILLIEYCPCANKYELQKREREVMEKLEATLYMRIPSMTPDEIKMYSENYYKQNKETYKIHNKNYYETHKEIYKTKYVNLLANMNNLFDFEQYNIYFGNHFMPSIYFICKQSFNSL